MAEFLIVACVFFFLFFSALQVVYLLESQSAVEAAAHFAARRFALCAREGFRKAEASALAEGDRLCRQRPGGESTASSTSIAIALEGGPRTPGTPHPGEAYRVRLSHLVEPTVPWAGELLFRILPLPKATACGRPCVVLQATRFVTVE